MAPTCVAFVSPRGGSGKSTLCAQLSSAFAILNPNRNVLLVDCSYHGDSSIYLLGGVRAPDEFVEGVRSQGQLVVSKNPTKTSAAFLSACYAERRSSVLSKAWRATVSRSVTPEEYSLTPRAHVPDAPPNLHVMPGTSALMTDVTAATRADMAKAVFEKLQALPADWMVIFDTDAEIMERPATLLALEVCQSAVVVLSAQFADWARVLDDPINGLFKALKHLRETSGQHALVSTFLFNKVTKTRNAEAPPFPFTGVNAAVEACAQIVGHAHDLTFKRNVGFSSMFNHVVVSEEAFAMSFVTAVHDVPETVMQRAAMSGVPVLAMTPKAGLTADVLDATKDILRAVCAKLDTQLARRAFA